MPVFPVILGFFRKKINSLEILRTLKYNNELDTHGSK